MKPCNFTGGDIFSPTVNRNGLRIQSSSGEPESDSCKTPLKNSMEGKNTQRLICSDSCGLSFEDIHSYWQTFLCCHFSQPVFKSVIFFLWIPKLGWKAEKGCILTSKTGVWSVEFVTPTIWRLMWLSDYITPSLPWLPCFYGYDDGDLFVSDATTWVSMVAMVTRFASLCQHQG